MTKPLLMLLTASCVAGCDVSRSTSSSVASPIADSYWALRRLDRTMVDPAEPELATIRFRADGGVDGTALCNSVSTGISWSSDKPGSAGRIVQGSGRPFVKTAAGCGRKHETDLTDAFWRKMEGTGRWSRHGMVLRIVFRDESRAELTVVAQPRSERTPSCTPADPNNLDCGMR